MIDVSTETLVPLNKSGIFPVGNPSAATRWRWHKKGIAGHKLEIIRQGSRVCTSREAIARFIAGTTAAASGEPAPLRSPAAREKAIKRAEKELADAGI
jgi:hypothetical protein